MFAEAFKKLELAEAATVLDEVNPLLDGTLFDPVEATVMAHDLPFYPGYTFLDIADFSVNPPARRFVIYKRGSATILDWTNGPIYALNKKVPIKLDDETVADYARFFFTYIRGRHGRFIITENVDDINWKEDPPPAARKAIGKMLGPVSIKKKDEKGTYCLEARVMFKDSLFKTDIYVKPDGTVTLTDEELLIEDMPVLDDVFGQ
ncbi:MAG TPA: hypothetical protein DEA55_06195 [Rhodospirillaceae bacterium]|nr:hypothetical protein [Rhodospirillaceae bacterium]